MNYNNCETKIFFCEIIVADRYLSSLEHLKKTIAWMRFADDNPLSPFPFCT